MMTTTEDPRHHCEEPPASTEHSALMRWILRDEIDYAALAARIAAGEDEEPSTLSRTGLGLARWRNDNPGSAQLALEIAEDPWWRNALRSSARGFKGPGGGRMTTVPTPIEYEATSVQMCGLNPWAIGAAAPSSGTIVGQHAVTGEAVSCDPFAYFRDNHIANPSMFVLSLPGLGKSTLIRKILLGACGWGQTPIVAGDIKGEYVKITKLVDGQVITLGHGGGHLNVLAAGTLGQAVVRAIAARDEAADPETIEKLDRLIAGAKMNIRARQINAICALIELIRYDTHSVRAFENSLIGIALDELYSATSDFSYENPPLLKDLYAAIDAGSPVMWKAAYKVDAESYRESITELMQALGALTSGPLGDIFADHTTEPIDLDAPMICIDVSSLDRGDTTLKAAVMLSCWADAYGTVEAAHLLTDAGLERQRLFLLTLDELWQVLGAGPGMVSRINEITRLNRNDGAGLLMITHTGRDLETLPTEADIKTAKGFIDRAGMVVCGGLPIGEVERLSGELKFTDAEAAMVTYWSRGAALRGSERRKRNPVGRGKFLVKVAKDNTPGIPIQTVLTDIEYDTGVHDTNARFAEYFAGQHPALDDAQMAGAL